MRDCFMNGTQLIAVINKADAQFNSDGTFKLVKQIMGWIPINYLGVNSANYNKALLYMKFLQDKHFKGIELDAVTVNEKDLDNIMHYLIDQDHTLTLHPLIIKNIINADWEKYQDQFITQIDCLGYNAAYREFAENHPIFNPSYYHKIIRNHMYLHDYVSKGITCADIIKIDKI